MIILAVDLGDVRTGLAICDKTEFLASPAGMIEERNREKLAKTIAAEAATRRAERIVLGLPVNMDGSHGPRAQAAEAFAEKLRQQTELPIELLDERCTTIAAHTELNVTNTRGKKRKEAVDQLAATLILENYLARRKNARQE